MKAPRRNRNAQRVFTFLTQRGYTQSQDDCVPATALYTDFRSWLEESTTHKDRINHQQFDRNLRIVAGVSMKVIDSDQGDGKRCRVYAGISAPDQDQVKEPAAADMPALVTEQVFTPEVIEFMGQSLLSVKVDDTVYVPMKPIVEGMGLQWGAQYSKIKATKRYSDVDIPLQTPGGPQEMVCLPLTKLNGWLFSINTDKVREEIRDAVIRYQEECHIVLHNDWNKGAAIRQEALTEEIKRKIIEAVESAHTVKDQTSSSYTDKDLDPLYGRLVTDDLTLADMVALLGEIEETARNKRFVRRSDTEAFALNAKSIFPYVARVMTHYPDPLDAKHVESFKSAYCAIMRYYKPLVIKGVIGRLVTFYNLPRF